MNHAHLRPRLAVPVLLGAALLAALVLVVAGSATAKPTKAAPPPTEVKVMTRNVYLGADLGPAIEAKGVSAFTEATGEVLRQVTANDFPVRAKGLAQEIIKKDPDLVGLQEVAEWRTGPPSLEPLLGGSPPKATTVRYDYLTELLKELNKGKARYRAVVVNPEFDFEAPGDENGVPGDGPNQLIANAEINGRLTMRDVILAKVGAEVKVSQSAEGPLQEPLLGRTLRRQGDRDPRLGLGRRERPWLGPVPLRRHPPRIVRPADRGAEHPRPAGGRTGGPERSAHQPAADDPGR